MLETLRARRAGLVSWTTREPGQRPWTEMLSPHHLSVPRHLQQGTPCPGAGRETLIQRQVQGHLCGENRGPSVSSSAVTVPLAVWTSGTLGEAPAFGVTPGTDSAAPGAALPGDTAGCEQWCSQEGQLHPPAPSRGLPSPGAVRWASQPRAVPPALGPGRGPLRLAECLGAGMISIHWGSGSAQWIIWGLPGKRQWAPPICRASPDRRCTARGPSPTVALNQQSQARHH